MAHNQWKSNNKRKKRRWLNVKELKKLTSRT
jgi:hypothetical protein